AKPLLQEFALDHEKAIDTPMDRARCTNHRIPVFKRAQGHVLERFHPDVAHERMSDAAQAVGSWRMQRPPPGKGSQPWVRIVEQLAVTTVGQVVTTGQQLMTIVPDGGHLQVEVYVTNADIGFIKVGQEAAIKLDSFPFTRFGTLHGK